jgi:hypothetical protein
MGPGEGERHMRVVGWGYGDRHSDRGGVLGVCQCGMHGIQTLQRVSQCENIIIHDVAALYCVATA